MNPQAMDLGFILRRIPGFAEFTMARSADRMRLQKTIYLLQAFGVYVGYDYNWYMRGPYCNILAVHAFVLDNFYGHIPSGEKTRFKSSVAQERFLNFLTFLDGKDPADLEIAVLLHYQVRIRGADGAAARDAVAGKRGGFTRDMVNRMWGEMRGYGLVG
ncbi:hypothetical protein IBTHAUMO2_330003 [Nitrosopumilaceae archaeon]|nr:hypothetical protein [Nitrosopumilus sp.]CAI9831625.1 hypothetical protein IBTHAUMO2_330003 [Nitrosopumilaceae archaeon]MDA7945345.1 hypothetical protein [Nitrosopumilus sp.]MDA7955321.1 hypothetical protein [Nitrosopumilus sp.]MDA7974285.1 hypothetical protein [Nitrosopumilus sp.]